MHAVAIDRSRPRIDRSLRTRIAAGTPVGALRRDAFGRRDRQTRPSPFLRAALEVEHAVVAETLGELGGLHAADALRANEHDHRSTHQVRVRIGAELIEWNQPRT